MSPEQARALPVDKRSDIWSFGCVLFEMLSGRHPFAGDTFSDVIARILSAEPEWTALPADTPARVVWLLRRCLEKDPKRRLHDVADARIELDEALVNPSGSGAVAAAAATPTPRRTGLATWERAARATALVLVALASILFVTKLQRQDASRGSGGPSFSSIVLPPALQLPRTDVGPFALSPNGRLLAFVAAETGGPTLLWIRHLDSLVVQPIAGTEGAAHPFWSPDSTSVAFIARPAKDAIGGFHAQLKKVDLARGQSVTNLAPVAFIATGAWSRDGVILFTPDGNAPLHRVPASGGVPTPVTSLDASQGDVQHSYPSFLPDGRHFVLHRGQPCRWRHGHSRHLSLLARRKSAAAPARRGAFSPQYANGHLLFPAGAGCWRSHSTPIGSS
jgi:hypothetical protein